MPPFPEADLKTFTIFVCFITGYISPCRLQECITSGTVLYYTIGEIEEGESGDGFVSKDRGVRDKTTEILVAGADPHFIVKHDVKCNYEWILHETKGKLEDKVVHSIATLLNVPELHDLDQVITYWCGKKGRKMTFGMLYTLLKHPGIIYNEEAARDLADMLRMFGYQVNVYKNKIK